MGVPARDAEEPEASAILEVRAGLVPQESADFAVIHDGSREVGPPRADVSARSQVAARPSSEALGLTPQASSASPRAALLAALGKAIGNAMAVGDLEAARVAHRALGELLASAATEPAGLVSLDRHRRGGAS